ncbi:MAG TPA: Hsp20/alpha crystallin family protein [Methanocorpusculum sp.]|nr:Hsp20/alpha crystallin family protein [Methanocorpusculum sp.]
MTEVPEDPFKDIVEFIQSMLSGNGAPEKKGPQVFGVKVIMGAGGKPQVISEKPRSKTIPVETFDMGDSIILQTALPPESSDDFSLSYENGILCLVSGENHEYKASCPLPGLDMSSLKTSLKNGVLEIICAKKAQTE